MKTNKIVFLFGFMISISCWSQIPRSSNYRQPAVHSHYDPSQMNEILGLERQNQAIQAKQIADANWMPIDPYRIFGTNVVLAKNAGWVRFYGDIEQYETNGILVDGWYSVIQNGEVTKSKFYVKNFPYLITENKIEYDDGFTAALIGGDLRPEINGNVPVIFLDYGKIYTTSPEMLKKKKEEQDRKTFASLMTHATNNEAWAQYSIGLRYLEGKGCETNRALGIEWITKSANSGYEEASNKLIKIKPAETNPIIPAISKK